MPDRPISEDTPIRLKIVVLLVGGSMTLIALLSSTVWWAATVSEKLTTIVAQNAAITANQAAMAQKQSDYEEKNNAEIEHLKGRTSDLESWHKMIDQQGDPAGRVRDENLQAQITQLRHDLDVMQAKNNKP